MITVENQENMLVIREDDREIRIDRNEWTVWKDGVSCPFECAASVSMGEKQTSIETVLSYEYEGIIDGLNLVVQVRLNRGNGHIVFELVPWRDEVMYDRIDFPGTVLSEKGYLVLPVQQGVLLDTCVPEEFPLHFDGNFACADAYVNAMGFYNEKQSWLWIVDSYCDAGYSVKYDRYQRISLHTLPCLGKTEYTRKYTLITSDGTMDYNGMAKHVRAWYESHGNVLTLKEKVQRKPNLKQLIGSCVWHTGIHSDISPDSRFYHAGGKNEAIVPIEEIEKQVVSFHQLGVGKIHLHVDGCGIAYDRRHPRFYPIDERTGGYPALEKLMETLHGYGDLLTIHDNYHDLYLDSPDFAESLQIHDRNGEPFFMAVWAGGKQSYLTGQAAPVFFERNLNVLKDHGIVPDGVYCDVFTCNPLDENFNSDNRMNRRDCARYRNMTFDVNNNRGGITSSEEVNGFAVNHIDTCHYAPYPFMMRQDGKMIGLPIPFFNLVFHDCLVIPWMTDVVNGVSYGLYAMLNGGIGYLKRDGAYVNTDGSFSQDLVDEKRIDIVRQIGKVHEKTAYAKMVEHRFIDNDPMRQKTVFDNGITVEINLHDNTYRITE
ncbi:MAG: DUF5696 domain-containing protein [Bulleidia sp.]